MPSETGACASTEATEMALRGIRDWVHARLGIFYSESKLDILLYRLQRLVQIEGLRDVVELHRKVVREQRADLFHPLAQCVSTTHTFFFREPEVLDIFREAIFPLLPRDEPVRIWSAACSSGQEPYTIAMLLCELVGSADARERFSILGSDVNQMALQRAESGVYSRSNMDEVPELLRSRYFRPRGLGQYEVAPVLREMCMFRRLNLKMVPWPFRSRFHVVFCRNVLYYFDVEQQTRVVEGLYDQTLPDGWLLTSSTESLRGLHSRWASVAPGVHCRSIAPALKLPARVEAAS